MVTPADVYSSNELCVSDDASERRCNGDYRAERRARHSSQIGKYTIKEAVMLRPL